MTDKTKNWQAPSSLPDAVIGSRLPVSHACGEDLRIADAQMPVVVELPAWVARGPVGISTWDLQWSKHAPTRQRGTHQ